MITTLLLSLLLTVAHPPEQQAVMTTYVLAERAGVSPNMAVCILLRESGGHTWAVGDGGRAVGAWQWWEPSIRLVMDDMGVSWDWEAYGDPRLDLVMSTEAAMHAMGRMGLWRWWSTWEGCQCNSMQKNGGQLQDTKDFTTSRHGDAYGHGSPATSTPGSLIYSLPGQMGADTQQYTSEKTATAK